MIKYQINLKYQQHIFAVQLSFIASSTQHELKLPTWIPGSYMIREFSKNIIDINVEQNNIKTTIEQHNKNTWMLSNLTIDTEVIVAYNVYAYDFGIRTAYLDDERAFFNPSSLCLYVVGTESNEHIIKINKLPDNFEIATGLKKINTNEYSASNYDELIDSPFEISYIWTLPFTVKNVKHTLVLSGIINPFDKDKLIADISKICAAQIDLFGGKAPFDNYTFLLNLGGEVFTGLEHRNSSALLAPYYSLPTPADLGTTPEIRTDYLKLLGLISHEYFHSWNVKRIKPEAFSPYNLNEENYTKQLWWFEGVTSYYDDLMLYRSGVIDLKCYLQLILDNINNVYKYNGANVQALTNSSLTSWIKYYRQDENSPNSMVSYYVKGALVGMCLDILIRSKTNNSNSLDDVLRGLFYKWQNDGLGIKDEELNSLIETFANCKLMDEVHEYISTTNKLPLANILNHVGLKLYEKISNNYTNNGKIIESESELDKFTDSKFDLGCKLIKENIGYRVVHVYDNSLASEYGLAVNDVLIALDNLKLDDIERQLNIVRDEHEIDLVYFRREELCTITITLTHMNSCAKHFLKIDDKDKLLKWL